MEGGGVGEWEGVVEWGKKGAIRELNPGPPVPKTGIIPLDQSPLVISCAPLPSSYTKILTIRQLSVLHTEMPNILYGKLQKQTERGKIGYCVWRI